MQRQNTVKHVGYLNVIITKYITKQNISIQIELPFYVQMYVLSAILALIVWKVQDRPIVSNGSATQHCQCCQREIDWILMIGFHLHMLQSGWRNSCSFIFKWTFGLVKSIVSVAKFCCSFFTDLLNCLSVTFRNWHSVSECCADLSQNCH